MLKRLILNPERDRPRRRFRVALVENHIGFGFPDQEFVSRLEGVEDCVVRYGLPVMLLPRRNNQDRPCSRKWFAPRVTTPLVKPGHTWSSGWFGRQHQLLLPG
jgi:hypothetical protein